MPSISALASSPSVQDAFDGCCEQCSPVPLFEQIFFASCNGFTGLLAGTPGCAHRLQNDCFVLNFHLSVDVVILGVQELCL